MYLIIIIFQPVPSKLDHVMKNATLYYNEKVL